MFSFCMKEGEGKICEYVTVIVYQNNEPRIGHCQLYFVITVMEILPFGTGKKI